MAHYLDASQLAECCKDLGLEAELDAIEAACNAAAEAIATFLHIVVDQPASTEPGFGGLCVGFGPATTKQPIPDELAQYDESSDWADATANEFSGEESGS